ncbi:hypothetical protein P7C73_g6789, partial [Tremellales sp. Uapishka_1]
MADVKDPKIAEGGCKCVLGADEQRRSGLPARADGQSDKSNTLTLSSTGTGDLAEFVSHLEPQRASFGYVRVKYANDDHSFREKFILVTWIGEQVSVHFGDVKAVLKAYSIEVSASTAADLKEDEIVQRLRRAGGANYDRSKFD